MEIEAAASILLLFLACLCAVMDAQSPQRVDFYNGDICKQDGGKLWTCKALKTCGSAQRLLRQRKSPLLCNFSGTFDRDAVVCCEPEVTGDSDTPRPPVSSSVPTSASPTHLPATTVGAKSQQKCREYAKSVFTTLDVEGSALIDNCANPKPLITKGKNAEPREFVHMALIGYGSKPNIEWLCGGSLISERFVLSAAHCTDGGRRGLASWVRLGEYNLKSNLDETNGLAQPEDYQIVERINHQAYNTEQFYDDIALYRLEKNVKFNKFIRPACIHTTHLFDKPYAIFTGWGPTEWGGPRSDILQKGNLTITESQICRAAWKDTMQIRYGSTEGIRDSSQMCTGHVLSGVEICQGSSGGPLQLRLRDPYCMYSIIGIKSFGGRCGGNILPEVYTRVSNYVQWIESVVWP